jgi:hypothetical protein
MAKNIAFVNREGVMISEADWRDLQKDPNYCTVRQYDNSVVQVTLKWVGRVPNPQNTFKEFWPVFILLVKNYKADGTLAVDPNDSDKTYYEEAHAIKAYEEFLLRWTESTVDEAGEFVEADNMLTPPAPPDPNKPMTVADDLGEGAW